MHSSRDFEMEETQSTDQVPEFDWHMANSLRVAEACNKLKEIDKSSENIARESRRNVAKFNVILRIGGQKAVLCFNDTLFVSGLNEKYVEVLKASVAPQQDAKCVAHYCGGSITQPSEFGLRENITQFFGFEERIKTTPICRSFRDCIGREGYFNEFALRPEAREKLGNTLRDVLAFRFFNEDSTSKAKSLGLVNKAKKNVPFDTVDELFDSTFQLQFGDSEQAIRLFLCNLQTKDSRLKLENEDDWKVVFANLLDTSLPTLLGELTNLNKNKLQPLERQVKKAEKEFEKSKIEGEKLQKQLQSDEQSEEKFVLEEKLLRKKEDYEVKKSEYVRLKNAYDDLFEREYVGAASEIISLINKWFRGNIRLEFHLTSYFDMCPNCQGTYKHDFSTQHQLQKVFLERIADKFMELGEPLAPLGGWIYVWLTPNNPLEIRLQLDEVGLFVSSREQYTVE
ncbi:MAG: hypothetical protein HON43_08000 [Alphaproteobacteria bacterium]|nr:hypothetical protein [Alphaproteobacteria bacterium]MBT5390708.1 hypothetical protein [Alphaproteobacteria bacterium]